MPPLSRNNNDDGNDHLDHNEGNPRGEWRCGDQGLNDLNEDAAEEAERADALEEELEAALDESDKALAQVETMKASLGAAASS